MSKGISTSLIFSLVFACAAGAAECAVKNNSRVAFLGDSITQQGQRREAGYVNLVVSVLAQNKIKVIPIKAGISGHKSNQMLARLDRDVINKKAQFLFLSCGVNDVWHGARGIKLEDYKKNITAIVEKAQKANITVCIMTATMIREDAGNAANKKLADYNAFLRDLAVRKKCLLADTNAAMQSELAKLRKQFPAAKGNLLTTDGVHMALPGDMMMARCLLRTVGIPEKNIDFEKLPCKAEVTIKVPLSFYREIYQASLKNGKGTKDVDSHIIFSVKK